MLFAVSARRAYDRKYHADVSSIARGSSGELVGATFLTLTVRLRVDVPLQAAQVIAPRASTVSKYLLLYLTCSHRNLGIQQRQAALFAQWTRSLTFSTTMNMNPGYKALYVRRHSDLNTVTTPVLTEMFREATDFIKHLRATALPEARKVIDDCDQEHAAKSNK